MHKAAQKAIKEFFDALWNSTSVTGLFDSFRQTIAEVLMELINTLMKFPLVSQIPGIMEIWKFVAILSMACIGIIYIIPSIRNLISIDDSIIKRMELKKMIPRTLYSFVLMYLSPMYIDLLIEFSNLLVSTIASNFPFTEFISGSIGSLKLSLISIIIMIVQLFFIVKTIIGYWLRVTETLFLTVASPALFTMWINPAWGGYISSWHSRLISLIFTSVAQALTLAIYGKVLGASLASTSLSGLCLSIAVLLLLDNIPHVFSQFICQDNSAQVVSKAKSKIKSVTKTIRKRKK